MDAFSLSGKARDRCGSDSASAAPSHIDRQQRGHRRHRGIQAIALLIALALPAACGSGLPSSSVATSVPSGSGAGTAAPSVEDSGTSSPAASAAAPGDAKVSSRVTAFFYAWYGTPDHDGAWRHWNQLAHTPPVDIASSFYPQRGPYSSRDPAVLASQMAEIRSAGVGAIAVSWWGRGSWEDGTLDAIFSAAAAAGIRVAFHIEPYTGRTAESVGADIAYLIGRYRAAPALMRVSRATGADPSSAPRPVFYVFASNRLAVDGLRTAIAGLRGTANDAVILLHSPRAVTATRVGADGVYTYDPLTTVTDFTTLLDDCRAANLLCSPSVAPGFDDTHAVANGQSVDRAGGARYDGEWSAAISARAEWVSVVSFNEWHEGTQIEPARDYAAAGRTYTGYDGAYGETPDQAPDAYLRRTAYWVERFTTAG